MQIEAAAMTVGKMEEYKQVQCDTRHLLNTRGITAFPTSMAPFPLTRRLTPVETNTSRYVPSLIFSSFLFVIASLFQYSSRRWVTSLFASRVFRYLSLCYFLSFRYILVPAPRNADLNV
jgi:hypothetical protein